MGECAKKTCVSLFLFNPEDKRLLTKQAGLLAYTSSSGSLPTCAVT